MRDEFGFELQPPRDGCIHPFLLVILVVLFAIFCLVWGLRPDPADAHEAGPLMPPGVIAQTLPSIAPVPTGKQPLGWDYPWSCCSGMDCAEISERDVTEGPSGYSIAGSHDAAPIGYQDKRIKESPDGEYHWCAHRSGLDEGKTICLFTPPKGF